MWVCCGCGGCGCCGLCVVDVDVVAHVIVVVVAVDVAVDMHVVVCMMNVLLLNVSFFVLFTLLTTVDVKRRTNF